MPFKRYHYLKILPCFWNDVINERKNFELRKDDRDYNVGDILVLQEWLNGEYTGKQCYRKIVYILKDCPEFGLMKGYCILGISKNLR